MPSRSLAQRNKSKSFSRPAISHVKWCEMRQSTLDAHCKFRVVEFSYRYLIGRQCQFGLLMFTKGALAAHPPNSVSSHNPSICQRTSKVPHINSFYIFRKLVVTVILFILLVTFNFYSVKGALLEFMVRRCPWMSVIEGDLQRWGHNNGGAVLCDAQ